MKNKYLFLVLILCGLVILPASSTSQFDWAGSTVYFVITDRLCNGDSTNDVNYGRKVDYVPSD